MRRECAQTEFTCAGLPSRPSAGARDRNQPSVPDIGHASLARMPRRVQHRHKPRHAAPLPAERVAALPFVWSPTAGRIIAPWSSHAGMSERDQQRLVCVLDFVAASPPDCACWCGRSGASRSRSRPMICVRGSRAGRRIARATARGCATIFITASRGRPDDDLQKPTSCVASEPALRSDVTGKRVDRAGGLCSCIFQTLALCSAADDRNPERSECALNTARSRPARAISF